MGMHSSVVGEDIRILDKDALIKLKVVNKMNKQLDEDALNVVSETGDVSFYEWDGYEIEGYWYKDVVDVLYAIAPFIRGWVEFSYEGGYNFRIVFEKRKPLYQRSNIDWDKIPKTEIVVGD
jgi:hypothetical protein